AVDRHHVHETAVGIEEHRARLAVDLHAADGDSELAGVAAEALEEAGDLLPSEDRVTPRRARAAAVAVHDRVGREQVDEPAHVAVLDGVEEPSGQAVTLLPRRLEARPVLVDVSARAHRELPAVVRALADARRNLVVAV